MSVYQKVAFLDTNTLHFICICLDYAKREQPSLDLSIDEDRRVIEQRLQEMKDRTLKPAIRKGLQTINWLLSQEDTQVQYSAISELELIWGRVRGSAVLNAAREGIPDRMWGNLRDAEVRDRVSKDELRDISKRVAELSGELEELGISALSADGSTRDILALSRDLAGLIYLAPNDGIIYAGALYVQADDLITSDKYFRSTVNEIHESSDQHFCEVREQIRALLSEAPLIEASEVILPKASTPAELIE